jgi:thiol-disulfide isomerase/thioredoxin
VATFLLAACGGAIQPDSDVAAPAAAPAEIAIPADFQIAVYQGEAVLGGQEVQFSELFEQGKPIVLNLWAGLCPPCRLEMPDFQAVNSQFGDEVLLVGLDVGPFTNLGTREDGQALLEELGVTYPAGTTSDANVVREYGLIGMPTTYFIKPDGELVQQWTGLLTEDKLTELVEELLDASADS